jgi:hypothetical protein
MSSSPSAKARRVFAARPRISWRHDRTVGSHKILKRGGWPDSPFHSIIPRRWGPRCLHASRSGLGSNLVTFETAESQWTRTPYTCRIRTRLPT